MKSFLFMFFACSLVPFASGCVRTQSFNRAPVTKLLTGGTLSERSQVYSLRQIKWKHQGTHGKILGNQYFMDTKFPITGAREKDTLSISTGKKSKAFAIGKVIRIRTQKKRYVILKIKSSFAPKWKTLHKGTSGTTLLQVEDETKKSLFTDSTSFPPDVPTGTQLLLQGKAYTILRSTVVKLKGAKLQRIAYEVEPRLPKTNMKDLSYEIQVPDQKEDLKYTILWRGSRLTGHYYTIGINRRRYSQKELENVLKSQKPSEQAMRSVPTLQGTATAFSLLGGATFAVGGFLALARRDDFPDAAQVIPWGIVGGGALLMFGVALPLNIVANQKVQYAAKSYNSSIRKQLKLPMKKQALQGFEKSYASNATPLLHTSTMGISNVAKK